MATENDAPEVKVIHVGYDQTDLQGAFVWGYLIGIAVGLSVAVLIYHEGFRHV